VPFPQPGMFDDWRDWARLLVQKLQQKQAASDENTKIVQDQVDNLQVDTPDLVVAAATSLHPKKYIPNVTLLANYTNTQDVYFTTDTATPLSIVVADINSILLPRVVSKITVTSGYSSGISNITTILERKLTSDSWNQAITIGSTVTDVFSTIAGQRLTISGFTGFESPIVDASKDVSYDYRLKIEANTGAASGNTLQLEISEITLEFVQLKR